MGNLTQKIVPNLWFGNQAEEAIIFYTSTFSDSKILKISHYKNTGQQVRSQPEDQVMTVEFEIAGQRFTALNGGPIFGFTPCISFFINCKSETACNILWKKLSNGGSVLISFKKYSCSDLYGWVQDKYGLSWQVMFNPNIETAQKVTPVLMFVGDQAGNAEEAMLFYTSIFNQAAITNISRYSQVQEPNKEGTVNYATFLLEGQEFIAMDSNHPHPFSFNEATSFIVNCEDQQEIDYYRKSLSADPAAEQSGWLKDKYGISWQIGSGIQCSG